MKLRRRRHIAAQVSVGMNTNWCFRPCLRYRGGRFGLVSLSLPFIFFVFFFVCWSFSSLLAVMTIQRDAFVRTWTLLHIGFVLSSFLSTVLCLSNSFCSFSSFRFVVYSLPSWSSTLWFRMQFFSSPCVRYSDGDMAAFFCFCVNLSTCSPFSPRASIFFSLFCHSLLFYSLLFVLAFHGPFNMSRAFYVIFDFDILRCFFLLVPYDLLWFHSYMGTLRRRWVKR